MQLSMVSYKSGSKGRVTPCGLKLKPVFFLTLILYFYDRTQKMLKGLITVEKDSQGTEG